MSHALPIEQHAFYIMDPSKYTWAKSLYRWFGPRTHRGWGLNWARANVAAELIQATPACTVITKRVRPRDPYSTTIQLRVSELVLLARLPREVSGHSSCQILAFEEVVERPFGGRVAD